VLVVVVFPEVSVLVAGVASVSWLPVAVSGEVSVLGPREPFHVDAVLSLSPFLSQSPARLLRISFCCCCSGTMLVLSRSPTCVVSSSSKLVPRFLRPSYDYHWFCFCCCSILLYLWCTYSVFVSTRFGLWLICCSGSSNGFCFVCFEAHCQTFESCHLTKKYLYGW